MIYRIFSDQLVAQIDSHGAELISLTGKNGTEYLCPKHRLNWDGHAPVLFPNTGAVHSTTSTICGSSFPYTQHGFAKSAEFSAEIINSCSVRCLLHSNKETLNTFPFSFELSITYTLSGNELDVRTEIRNTDCAKPMYCSIGFHPGFSCPIDNSESAEDYELFFPEEMTADRMLLNNGLVSGIAEKFWDNMSCLPIREGMFDNGSFSMTHLSSHVIELRSKKSKSSIRLKFNDFPNLIIWAPKHKQITNICIEPWYGRADRVCGEADVTEKPDTLMILPFEKAELRYSVITH